MVRFFLKNKKINDNKLIVYYYKIEKKLMKTFFSNLRRQNNRRFCQNSRQNFKLRYKENRIHDIGKAIRFHSPGSGFGCANVRAIFAFRTNAQHQVEDNLHSNQFRPVF